MSTVLQGQTAQTTHRAKAYKAIALVIAQMPDEFTATQLYKLAGIKDSMWTRKTVATVLEQDFKCRTVGWCGKQRWKKETI